MAWWKRTGEDPTALPPTRHTAAETRTSPEVPAAAPAFDIVRRGYDRAEVDARVADVQRALASRRMAVDTARLRAAGSANGLTIVRRGYDRAQVETWFANAADRLDAR